MLAQELTAEDVAEAISARASGTHSGSSNTQCGQRLLSAVDTVAGSAPHTNEATKRARRNAETMQHHFGLSAYFLTFTPDDDNTIEMLSDEELTARAKERTQLRIKYPARDDCAGLFGIPTAFTASVEEQGRSSCHGHMQVWVKEFNIWREKLHSPSQRDRREAEDKMLQQITWTRAFPHSCTVPNPYERRNLMAVDDQKLRILRHKQGQTAFRGIVAYCAHCTKDARTDTISRQTHKKIKSHSSRTSEKH
eukprot:scaffold210072_cov86-Attheya_sp.AAC.1